MSGRDSDLQWQGAVPRSRRFDDVYFDAADGAAESEFVFLQASELPARWSGRPSFVIAETGFGTGLNLLVTWAAWRQTRKPGQRLHYVSVEGWPLSRGELSRALTPWTRLSALSKRLIERYPVRSPGFHRIAFPDDGLFLTLMFGAVDQVLPQLEARVDAWYLDGFAPSRNPDMWSEGVWTEMARLSVTGASVATFTAAGSVRRGLEARGFEIQRRPGFGAKRERLVGRFAGSSASRRPAWCTPDPGSPPGRVAIVGNGLGASWLQTALRERGLEAEVFGDRRPAASDNPLANVMPRLPASRSIAGRLDWSGFLHATRGWQDDHRLDTCGSLMLAVATGEGQRQAKVAARWGRRGGLEPVDADTASDLAGVRLTRGGLWLPTAGLVAGPIHASDPVEARIAACMRGPSGWTLVTAEGQEHTGYDAVIIAAGPGTRSLLDNCHCPLAGFAGQISRVRPSAWSQALRVTLVGGGYLTPATDQDHILGATFAAAGLDDPVAETVQEHERNRKAWTQAMPEAPLGPVTGGWAGLRVATPDRLPMAGPVQSRSPFIESFCDLRKRPLRDHSPESGQERGLHVLAGLGSRGFSHAPLAAELVVSRMLGDPWPLERDMALALDPARFMVRDLKRGKL